MASQAINNAVLQIQSSPALVRGCRSNCKHDKGGVSHRGAPKFSARNKSLSCASSVRPVLLCPSVSQELSILYSYVYMWLAVNIQDDWPPHHWFVVFTDFVDPRVIWPRKRGEQYETLIR